MSRYVDIENLDFITYNDIPNGYTDSFDSGVLYAMNLIDNVISTMRCKDCKYNKEHHPFNGKERITVFWCEMENRNTRHNDNPNWFCADWKKKDK